MRNDWYTSQRKRNGDGSMEKMSNCCVHSRKKTDLLVNGKSTLRIIQTLENENSTSSLLFEKRENKIEILVEFDRIKLGRGSWLFSARGPSKIKVASLSNRRRRSTGVHHTSHPLDASTAHSCPLIRTLECKMLLS